MSAPQRTPPSPVPAVDRRALREWWRVLFVPGDVFQVQATDGSALWAGVYHSTDFDALADHIEALTRLQPRVRLAVTLNPLQPDLLSAGPLAPAAAFAGPTQVRERRWLPVVITGAAEPARELASRVGATLGAEGWPAPVLCYTPEGAALLYRVRLRMTREDEAVLAGTLRTLCSRFLAPEAEISNRGLSPAFAVGIPGTGPEADRWTVIKAPSWIDMVPREELTADRSPEVHAAPAPTPAPLPRIVESFVEPIATPVVTPVAPVAPPLPVEAPVFAQVPGLPPAPIPPGHDEFESGLLMLDEAFGLVAAPGGRLLEPEDLPPLPAGVQADTSHDAFSKAAVAAAHAPVTPVPNRPVAPVTIEPIVDVDPVAPQPTPPAPAPPPPVPAPPAPPAPPPPVQAAPEPWSPPPLPVDEPRAAPSSPPPTALVLPGSLPVFDGAALLDRYRARHQRLSGVVSWPFDALNRGGSVLAGLVVIEGNDAEINTALALQILWHAVVGSGETSLAGGFLSFHLSRPALVDALVSHLSGLSVDVLHHGQPRQRVDPVDGLRLTASARRRLTSAITALDAAAHRVHLLDAETAPVPVDLRPREWIAAMTTEARRRADATRTVWVIDDWSGWLNASAHDDPVVELLAHLRNQPDDVVVILSDDAPDQLRQASTVQVVATPQPAGGTTSNAVVVTTSETRRGRGRATVTLRFDADAYRFTVPAASRKSRA